MSVVTLIEDRLKIIVSDGPASGQPLGTFTLCEATEPDGKKELTYVWRNGKNGLEMGNAYWQTVPSLDKGSERLAIFFEGGLGSMMGWIYCSRYTSSQKMPPDRPWFRPEDNIHGSVCYGSNDPKKSVDCSYGFGFEAILK